MQPDEERAMPVRVLSTGACVIMELGVNHPPGM